MYHLRLKIFIFFCVGGLLIMVSRLVSLQTLGVEEAREQISQMRILPAQRRPTIRGKILDRRERPLALDEPAFYLQIKYELTRYLDPHWQEGRILSQISKDRPRADVEAELREEWQETTDRLNRIVSLAYQLADVSESDILFEIERINNRMWEMSRRIWWRRRNRSAPWSQYFEIRDTIGPDKVITIDLYEMHKSFPLVELKNEMDLLRAQRVLTEMEGLEIEAQAKRTYPYGHAASQLIGWVGPANENDFGLFENDEYMRYLSGELLGKFGIEEIYEPVLRGRRGEVIYDREGTLLERKDPEYGRNVQLTIDIELQRAVEALLADTRLPHQGKLSAAVVLDAARNDILAIASIPTFDLNTIRRYEYYNKVYTDPNTPLVHRALSKNYPPGSTVKPLILVAGLEERRITPHEIIHCGYELPPKGWPKCISQWKFGNPHDNKWDNNGRNALCGSCNIYFSRLADRLDTRNLQQWLMRFGYGQAVLPTPMPDDLPVSAPLTKKIPQAYGSLIDGSYVKSGIQPSPASAISELPDIASFEKRWWGMGQGNLRATVLQVANALSIIARDGVYKAPRLVFDESDPLNDRYRHRVPISAKTLAVVRDGLHAVVYESGGTASTVFKKAELDERGITLYGKTGSTENPEHAWFQCLAEDAAGRSLVIVTLVEGGQSGSGEATPLGKEILWVCNEFGYIGTKPIVEPSEQD